MTDHLAARPGMRARWLAIVVAAFVAVGCAPAPDERSASPASTPAASLPAGFKSIVGLVMGTGTYPTYEVVVPANWVSAGDRRFVVKYTFEHPPVLGLSVWDVSRVFRDPCRWVGQDYDPGPTVDDLVAALVAQPMRNASQPVDVTLAGYSGKYVEWSVPADLQSSTWTDFDACDIDPNDVVHRNFHSWLGNGMGNRYEQVPG